MKKLNTFSIDIPLFAKSIGLTESQALSFLNDGRIIGRLGEFTHSNFINGKREKENSSFDIIDDDNIKTEVRSITKTVSFASSKEIGFGRKVTEEGFNKKLESLDKFVLLDLRNLHKGKYDTIEITKEDLPKLGLGKNKSISSKKFFKIYDTNK